MPTVLSRNDVAAFRNGAEFSTLLERFQSWPATSRMSGESRAVLYWIIKQSRPRVVAEIGTLFAGTSEVIARAIVENGIAGRFETTDPYGAATCPPIIAQWPEELRAVTTFHALNSMAFLSDASARGVQFDVVLIDGNHDFEFALFDLQMAARLLRPGGVIVMDNAEQTGPFYAGKQFLERNQAWRELGDSIASNDSASPFNPRRSSVAGTTFMLLQAPPHLTISTGPQSWGPQRLDVHYVAGLSIDLPSQRTAGRLRYQAILRSITHAGRRGQERFDVCEIRLDVDGTAKQIVHPFDAPLRTDIHETFDDAAKIFEIDMSWIADPGMPPLALSALPAPWEGKPLS